MKIKTPLVLWHGGGMTNGKPDPVFSLDMHVTNVLATSGIDSSVPPRGSVHLWRVDDKSDSHEFIFDLCDHQSAIHAVRFSPCGLMLAAASDRMITVYKATSLDVWRTLSDTKSVVRTWIHTNIGEIYDLEWSPLSDYIVVGSINGKAEIVRVEGRESLPLTGHNNYVQGVAWDPMNEFVVTQSADRSVRLHPLKPKKNAAQALKLSTRGQVVLRTFNPNSLPDVPDDTNISTTAPVPTTKANGVNLFASSTESCFFRRPACSPDGALLVTPMGIYNPETPNLTHQESGEIAAKSPSYCTHVFSRLSLTHFADVFSVTQQQGAGCAPIYSLVGLEEPSVAVRFCPRVFKNNISTNEFTPVLCGAYRMIFAVVTTSSVYLYDTQHHHPIVKVAGIHYATINDATWTSDGTCLIVCSSDGYVSFLRFNEKDSSVNELGEVISIQDTPECIKATFPSLYGAVLKKSGMEHMNDGDSGVIVEPREANEKSISTNVGYHEQLSSLPTPIEGIAPPTSLQSVVADMSSAEIDVDKDAMIVE